MIMDIWLIAVKNAAIDTNKTDTLSATFYSLPSPEPVSSVANTINPHLNLNALIDDFFNA